MEVERESVKLSLSNELINESCILSMQAHKHNQDYLTNSKKDGGVSSSKEVLIIAFKGSLEVNGFYQDDHFGVTDVDCNQFPSLQRIAQGQLAKVNGSSLKTFRDLLNNSGFKEVEKAVNEGKKSYSQDIHPAVQ
ncbi:hypothetical protein L1987_08337 [Smallanthus sonchifolius]|uniref:Uncharacterized protein n=1 Tax=Smallanthus sonchifolius TaxID=185202 RepID=A0ACB9JKS3_9ASTR|nr:hypothetical protein L1987_08337 [Smallanthus sonchifolius]